MTTSSGDAWTARVEEMVMARKNGLHRAYVCFCHFPQEAHLHAIQHLHPEEAIYLTSLVHRPRRKSYLLGRYAAKRALGSLLAEPDLRRIWVRNGVFEQPIVQYSDQSSICACVSISHCEDFGTALAFQEDHPMGIDLERISAAHNTTIESQMTDAEKRLTRDLPCSITVALTLLWTAKEALSKILKTGLMTPMSVFEINQIDWNGRSAVSRFTNFPQYKTVSFETGGLICSVALPRLSEWSADSSWNCMIPDGAKTHE